ncbi:C40 family peptidase [Crenobacter luteus]|nr:C40 family peptidase [Crenobacter luteus]
MKLHLRLFAMLLVAFTAFAHAAPERSQGDDDPIAKFASPGEEAVGDLLLQAMSLIGVAYRFGGSTPDSGLDCSGFIQYVFKKSLRVNLPRTAAEMARVGKPVDRGELVPGDLVFFNTRGFAFSHVGIYMGNGRFIHSPRSGKSVEITSMGIDYWVQRYNGARRVQRGSANLAAELTDRPPADKPQRAAASVRAAEPRRAVAQREEEAPARGRYRRVEVETQAKCPRGRDCPAPKAAVERRADERKKSRDEETRGRRKAEATEPPKAKRKDASEKRPTQQKDRG